MRRAILAFLACLTLAACAGSGGLGAASGPTTNAQSTSLAAALAASSSGSPAPSVPPTPTPTPTISAGATYADGIPREIDGEHVFRPREAASVAQGSQPYLVGGWTESSPIACPSASYPAAWPSAEIAAVMLLEG